MDARHRYIALKTVMRKEVVRFMRIWPQTLVPPVITQTLYFLIFGRFIGSQIRDIHGVSYMAFIVPGLMMMSIINNSFVNVAGSFFSSKFQRSIEEMLVSPMPSYIIVGGYVLAGMLRGMIVGVLVFCVSILFTKPVIYQPGLILLFMVMTSAVFALGGMTNGILAKKFDDISIFPTFLLIPMTYLGGVFYSITNLPEFWQSVSRFNPVLYMVNGFRYGFYGFSDVNVWVSFFILSGLIVVLSGVNLFLLNKGTGLKS